MATRCDAERNRSWPRFRVLVRRKTLGVLINSVEAHTADPVSDCRLIVSCRCALLWSENIALQSRSESICDAERR